MATIETQQLVRRGLALEYATLGWNVVGCGVLVWAALSSRSVALFGFGMDSVIEIFASVVVVWQLRAVHKEGERKALRCIGAAFMLLAAYLIVQSSLALVRGVRPAESLLGIVWLVLTCAVMFALAYGKKKTGDALQHAVLQAEAKVTVVDGILAAVVLASLLCSAFWGAWWVDAVAGYVIAGYGIKEGLHAWN